MSLRSSQISALRRLADARMRRADATLSSAQQTCQRREEAQKRATEVAKVKAEAANDYTRQRFMDLGETRETANAFVAIAAGASLARRDATSAELTAIRAEQRKDDAEHARTTAAIACRSLKERIGRLETLHKQCRSEAFKRGERQLEDEIAESFGRG